MTTNTWLPDSEMDSAEYDDSESADEDHRNGEGLRPFMPHKE